VRPGFIGGEPLFQIAHAGEPGVELVAVPAPSSRWSAFASAPTTSMTLRPWRMSWAWRACSAGVSLTKRRVKSRMALFSAGIMEPFSV
jgi:hypothetical protein